MPLNLNKSSYKNPNDFELIQKLRSNDVKTIEDIFEAKKPQYKERFRQCMRRAKGLEEKKSDPPVEWLQELKFKMMENNWGSNCYELTEKGEKKKVGCWGSLLNFKPEKKTFEEWFFGKGEWYEETCDCVAFRFFLVKAIMSFDSWATAYIFNMGLIESIPGKSKMEKIARNSKKWFPPKSYYFYLFTRVTDLFLKESITHRPFDEMRSVLSSDLWMSFYGQDDKKWAKLMQYDPTLELKNWLTTVVSNFAIDLIPKEHKKSLLDFIDIDYDKMYKNDQDLLNERLWVELICCIDNEVSKCDMKTKYIIEGKKLGKTSKEIAKALMMTDSAVDKRYHDWKTRMRVKYNQLYFNLYERGY